MKKRLFFNLLLAMLLGATNAWAADGDIFTAPVTVIQNGETSQKEMRFQVLSESAKTCGTYGTYDEISDVATPAINFRIIGDVVIPNTVNGYIVTGIGDYSFCRCSMGHIMLPESINYVGKLAFNECFSLLEIDLPSKVSTIGVEAFRRCENLQHATIYCKEIPFNCFAYCYKLSSVTIKSPITYVGSNAFAYCHKLESITFPAGLEYIDRWAISDCENLKSVTLTCSRIDASAFFGSCERLKEVIITSETPPTITVPSSSGWTEAALFSGVPSNAVLIVPDRTKYLQEPWTSWFSEIKSFLPTVEQTVNTWGYYSVGLTWDLYDYSHGYTESVTASDILDLMIDGVPAVPEVWEGYNELIVSRDPKHIPQEVSFLRKTSEGLVPYKLHYNVHNYGFSINDKEMTSLDMYDIPGLVSGSAYIAVPIYDPDSPTLVLDNATLEWDVLDDGLYLHSGQSPLRFNVKGDCSIKVPNTRGIGMDYSHLIIEGGGKLHISSKYVNFNSWLGSKLTIQDNTVVIGESEDGRGYYSEEWDTFTIKDGGVFAAQSKVEPIVYDDKPVLGEGIDIRYPVGADLGDSCVLNADGTKVTNDWVVIGPDNQATRDMIAEINNAKRKLGFSINGKEMTVADMNDVPGVMSGSAYIEVSETGVPTLVLDNATLEWDTTGRHALYNHDTGQDGLTIKVLGDCTIKAPNAYAALEIDVAKMITIEGGGTLHIISGQYPIETWVVSTLRIQDGTTVIAKSENGYSAVWDNDGANIEIRDGGVFAAFSKYEPLYLDSGAKVTLGEGIALRYPVGAYWKDGKYVYYADGTEVKNDWVVIGPDDQKTQDLIDELTIGDIRKLGFSINGQEMTTANMDDVPGMVSGSAHVEEDESCNPVLVLDNATLEWDNSFGLNSFSATHWIKIRVLGDCTIKSPNGTTFALMLSTLTSIEGGGTLHIISSSYPIIMNNSRLKIRDNTTVTVQSEIMGSALWGVDGPTIEITEGGVFATYGTSEPIHLGTEGNFDLGDGIALRYPAGAYIGSDNVIYNADGTEVTNDWVVIGPDDQKTQDLIDGVDEIVNSRQPTDNGFIYNLAGQQIVNGTPRLQSRLGSKESKKWSNGKLPRGIYIQNGKKVIRK